MGQSDTNKALNETTFERVLLRRATLLAILLALLPTLAIHINYLIAATEGTVPWCNPYLDSCTSISATGRSGTAFYFFKATMLPMAAVYWLYWKISNQILGLQNYDRQLIKYLGATAVLALTVYVLTLGAVGEAYQLSRRIGIILYFTLTYLCQLLIVNRLMISYPRATLLQAQQSLLGLILAIGVLTLALDALMDDYDSIEDAIEWLLALLLHANFLLAALFWRSTLARGSPLES